MKLLREPREPKPQSNEQRKNEAPNFSHYDLSNAKLEKAFLKYALLKGANFTSAQLSGAVFDSADLSCADLRESRLVGCSFYGTNLDSAQFDYTVMTESTFKSVHFTDVDFRNCHIDATVFEECYFSNCTFDSKRLRNVQFKDCTIEGSSFNHVVFDKTGWNNCTVLGSSIKDARVLPSSNFCASTFKHVDFSGLCVYLGDKGYSYYICKFDDVTKISKPYASIKTGPSIFKDAIFDYVRFVCPHYYHYDNYLGCEDQNLIDADYLKQQCAAGSLKHCLFVSSLEDIKNVGITGKDVEHFIRFRHGFFSNEHYAFAQGKSNMLLNSIIESMMPVRDKRYLIRLFLRKGANPLEKFHPKPLPFFNALQREHYHCCASLVNNLTDSQQLQNLACDLLYSNIPGDKIARGLKILSDAGFSLATRYQKFSDLVPELTDGVTVFHIALFRSLFSFVEHILKDNKLFYVDQRSNKTVLHDVIECEEWYYARKLIELGASCSYPDNAGISPLDLLIEKKKFDLIRLMIDPTKKSCIMNIELFSVQGNDGHTPFYHFVIHNQWQLLKYILSQAVKLKVFINVNNQSADGTTPLIEACKRRLHHIVGLFCSYKVSNLNSADVLGKTALHWAVEKSHVESVISLLRCEHIDTTIRDKNKKTALCYALENQDIPIIQAFIEYSKASISGCFAVALDKKK